MYDSNFKLVDPRPKRRRVNLCGPETSHEHRHHHRMQVVYTRQMRERRIFMDELKEQRDYLEKQMMRSIIKSIGPKWYQALSVPQRMALDTLESSIYQDILEARPRRTTMVMKILGIYPRPSVTELMNCVNMGRDDPKAMLAHMFLLNYGHTFDGKQHWYCLNARLMLSSILYLGFENIVELLKKRFSPDEESPKKSTKIKRKKDPPLKSPYLQKMVATLYEGHVNKPYRLPPLPDVADELNEPFEEEPPIPKPPPPPPPPPPPKKRLPISYCEKLAGIEHTIEPIKDEPFLRRNGDRSSKIKLRTAKIKTEKKKYGMGGMSYKKPPKPPKPTVPSTGQDNAQYVIKGVHLINGRAVFVLESVCILPQDGETIHGGYAYLNGGFVNIHCGMRGTPPPPPQAPCDCLKKYQKTAINYLKSSKCYCNHYYDYGHEGTFSPTEVPYFEKPTRTTPFNFNYNTIYDLDEKSLHIGREFKRVWDTDSMLRGPSDETKEKKKKKKRSSSECLGPNPKVEDYLLCALHLMRQQNIAARLPDIHKVPELKEWMRHRLHGPLTPEQREKCLLKSNRCWTFFKTLESPTRSFGHIDPPNDPQFNHVTNWLNKQKLNDRFRRYQDLYRLKLFRSYAHINNLMWPSMFQDKFPDKKFREIYFSYLYSRVQDLTMIHPYSTRETTDRAIIIGKKRYICIPSGMETLQS